MRRPVFVLALLAVLAALVLDWTPAGAAEPEVHFEPASGDCSPGRPWFVTGSGYPPSTAVEIVIPRMTESIPLTSSTTTADGDFRVELPDSFPESCRPGQLLGVAAVAETPDERVFRIASYEVDSPYWLHVVSCSERSLAIRGGGFPPATELSLMLVQDQPFTDHAAILATVTTDGRGAFQWSSSQHGCLPPGHTITSGTRKARVRLRPLPAATGQGVPEREDAGAELILGALALVTLAVARLVVSSRRR